MHPNSAWALAEGSYSVTENALEARIRAAAVGQAGQLPPPLLGYPPGLARAETLLTLTVYVDAPATLFLDVYGQHYSISSPASHWVFGDLYGLCGGSSLCAGTSGEMMLSPGQSVSLDVVMSAFAAGDGGTGFDAKDLELRMTIVALGPDNSPVALHLVPEPMTSVLAGLGLLVFVCCRRRSAR
jgi:hypothetical protein